MANIYFGVVEDRNDPLRLGRVQVRIAGMHTPDKTVLPTEDLPWATVIQNGTGFTPKEADSVMVVFYDDECQMPVVIGIVPTVPQKNNVFVNTSEASIKWTDALTPAGRDVPTNPTEASGATPGDVPTPSAQDPETNNLVKDSITKSTSVSDVTTLVVESSSQSSGGTNAFTASKLSLGGSTKSDKEKLYNLIAVSGGDVASAQKNIMQSISEATKTSIPNDLFNGKISPAQLLGQANNIIGGLTASLGVSKLTEVLGFGVGNLNARLGNTLTQNVQSGVLKSLGTNGISDLSRISNISSTINSTTANLTSRLQTTAKNYVTSAIANSLGTKGLAALSQANNIAGMVQAGPTALQNRLQTMAKNALSSAIIKSTGIDGVSALVRASQISSLLGLGNLNNFVTGFSNQSMGDLGSSLKNSLTTAADNAINTITGTASNLAESASNLISGVTTAIKGGVEAVVKGISGTPSKLAECAKSVDELKSKLADPKEAATLVGKGLTSEVATSMNVGGTKTAFKEAESKGLTKLTSESFKDENGKQVERGTTPPTQGTIGGANYGGSTEKPSAPTKQDTEKFSAGTTRKVDTESITEKGDLETLKNVGETCGIKTTESMATYLTVIFYLCGKTFKPQLERIDYTVSELLSRYPLAFNGDESMAAEYALESKSATDFFNFVYDVSNDGRKLGNKYPGDGSKYAGFGYIPIRGRKEYEKYSDLLVAPKLLDQGRNFSDKNIWAKIAAYKFLEATSGICPTAHPQFFYSACKTFGINILDAELIYTNLYGAGTQVSNGVGDKVAGSDSGTHPLYRYGREDEESVYGFSDPNKKYPTDYVINRPSLSRLSRGEITDTIVTRKESERKFGVKLPFKMGVWNQPHASFGAQYPYNNVNETESGHVIEYDDTPGHERLHWYHRSGTFTEIDPSGVRVNRIIGDDYTIVDRNGFISIEGNANLTVGGNVNIYCRSNANIEVEGSTELKVGGSLTTQVANDVNFNVGGNFNLWANGNMNLQCAQNAHILSKENMYQTAYQNMHIESLENMYQMSLKDFNHTVKGHIKNNYLKDYSEYIGGEKYEETVGKVSVLNDANMLIETKSSLDFNAASTIKIKGSRIDFNPSATPTKPVSHDDFMTKDGKYSHIHPIDSTEALINGMVTPVAGSPINPDIKPFDIPYPSGGFETKLETSEEMTSETAKAYQNSMNQEEGEPTTVPSAKTHKPDTSSAGEFVYTPEIKEGTVFTANYKLSTNFKLKNIWGICDKPFGNPDNALRDQVGLTKTQIVYNLSLLATNVLEVVGPHLPGGLEGRGSKWWITSSYRKGNGSSDHCKGLAVDIQIAGRNKQEHLEYAKKLSGLVKYDQILLEFSGSKSVWIHIGLGAYGYGGKQIRNQAATARLTGKKTQIVNSGEFQIC